MGHWAHAEAAPGRRSGESMQFSDFWNVVSPDEVYLPGESGYFIEGMLFGGVIGFGGAASASTYELSSGDYPLDRISVLALSETRSGNDCFFIGIDRFVLSYNISILVLTFAVHSRFGGGREVDGPRPHASLGSV